VEADINRYPMKKGFWFFLVTLGCHSAFSQSSFQPATPLPSGVNYFTGSIAPMPHGVSGSAADVRSRSFSGSGYFNPAGSTIDTSLALQLGNGVSPFAASSAQVQSVPEPSAIALVNLAAVLALAKSVSHRRRAPG
jgi:hypothetical protein